MEKPVIIFGAKGLGRSALEIFQSNDVVVFGFLDPDTSLHNTEINSIPVLGDPEDHGFTKLIGQKCEAFVATDDNVLRKGQVSYLMKTRKVMPTNAIHSHAILSKSVKIGHGNFIDAGAILGPGVELGHHCIVNARTCIGYDTVVGDFVQIGSGTSINSGVKVGRNAFIGSGVTIVSGVEIGAGARIGAGSVVIGNVGKKETVFGNPAAKVKA